MRPLNTIKKCLICQGFGVGFRIVKLFCITDVFKSLDKLVITCNNSAQRFACWQRISDARPWIPRV